MLPTLSSTHGYLALTLIIGLWVAAMRRRNATLAFDWRDPEDPTSDNYTFCEYENRFAYVLGSVLKGSTTHVPRHVSTTAYDSTSADEVGRL